MTDLTPMVMASLLRKDTPKRLIDVFDKLDADKDKILTRDEVIFGPPT